MPRSIGTTVVIKKQLSGAYPGVWRKNKDTGLTDRGEFEKNQAIRGT